MGDINIAQIVESASSIQAYNQEQANTANANAYLAPANMNPLSVLKGASLVIEPSENGIPEPACGGTAPQTNIPGSPKLEGAGGNRGSIRTPSKVDKNINPSSFHPEHPHQFDSIKNKIRKKAL